MLPADQSPWLAADDAEAGFELREDAATRAEELHRVAAELVSGHHVTVKDVAIAKTRAAEAHIRTRRAHLAAAEQHRRTAEAHERAAQTHSDAAAHGIGHVATHLEAVEVYRAARDAEYRAAARCQRLAERE